MRPLEDEGQGILRNLKQKKKEEKKFKREGRGGEGKRQSQRHKNIS